MPDPAIQSIALDTLGALHRHHHGLFGWCRDCAADYRMEIPAEQRKPALFNVSMPTLIAKHGAGCLIATMAPIPCPRCGGHRTEYRVTSPSKGSG